MRFINILTSTLILPSDLQLEISRGLFLARLRVNNFKALIPYPILAIWPVHFHLIDLITLQ